MAIPLIALVGMLGYVAGSSVENAVNIDRAPDLIDATSLPAASFGRYIQDERAAAVVYLFAPTAAHLQAYNSAIAATDAHEAAFKAAMTSPATKGSETASEAKSISAIVADLGQLPTLRNAVQGRVVTPLDALGLYSTALAAEPKLFLLMTNSEASTSQQGQAIGLITTVQAREELSEEDALVAGMLAGKRETKADRAAIASMAAERQADMQYADFILTPANLAIYNSALTGSSAMQQDLSNIEQALSAGEPLSALRLSSAQWQGLTTALLADQYNGGVAIAKAILVADHQQSRSAWTRVAVTSGIALLGLIITIVVTSLVGRSIIRRLRGLETTARTLAEDQLPDVITRLRHGEDVDVAIEAPPMRAGAGSGSDGGSGSGPGSGSRDEIGRVSQAFDQVRQTAIRAAVDEARLRNGLNDVFRSLARRSQSLLHRQLTLLDQMERRASDPEALDDLFRLDHLTTRMRRHAEGLVILAGAPPARGWSSPVRMVDVMRGAVAEVEDYARVTVVTRSQAAVAGSAVADVIHLLAELIENATTMSPPSTSVRVFGDTVANGFAIEIEDRGLGMAGARLAELNERLANPPEFNPSDSDQLGLFVVGQLAKRHGIAVTLRVSPFGGTSAIVLIPRQLVVTEAEFRAGLPGGPAAIAAGPEAGSGPGPGSGPGSGPGFGVGPAGDGAGAGFGAGAGGLDVGAGGLDIGGDVVRSSGNGLGYTPRGGDGDYARPAAGLPGGDTGDGLTQAPGIRISGPLRSQDPAWPGSDPAVTGAANGGLGGPGGPGGPVGPAIGGGAIAGGTNGTVADADADADADAGRWPGAGPDELPRRHQNQPAGGPGPGGGAERIGPDVTALPAFDVFAPRQNPQDAQPEQTRSAPAQFSEPTADPSFTPAPLAEPATERPRFTPVSAAGPAAGAPARPTSGPAGPASRPAGPAAARPTFTPFSSDPYPATGSAPYPPVGGTPYPAAGTAPYADQPTPFPGWTGPDGSGPSGGAGSGAGRETASEPAGGVTGEPGGGARSGPGRPEGPPTTMRPVASSSRRSRPPWEQSGPMPVIPDVSASGAPAETSASDDVEGLPRRVKQANLAPQLRANPPRRMVTVASDAMLPGGPTPAEIRKTMSALQRGWQEGRAQAIESGPEPGGPSRPESFGPAANGPGGSGPPQSQAGEEQDLSVGEEADEGSDAT